MKIVSKILILIVLLLSVDGKSQQNKLQKFSIKEGLPSLTIHNITQDKIGYLWLTTDKGFVRFDGHEFINIQNITKPDSLFLKNKKNELLYNDTIRKNIIVDNKITSIKLINNEFWVSTNGSGISIFNSDDYTFKRKINKYNSFISDQINTVFKDSQNTIWIATKNDGLYKYSNQTIENAIKPTIYIEKIAINYKKLVPINNTVLELKPTDNNISFHFKTVDLQKPNSILYRHKLRGKFSAWSKKNSIEFANLNPGNYTFIVQSKKENVVSDAKSFSFFINTPIYKKPWFIILCFAVVLLILFFIVDLHIRKLNKKNEEKVAQLKFKNHVLQLEQKALQSQMNPHFIFNVLNGIKALGNTGKTKELNTTISQFSVLLRSVLNNSRLEEISLKDEIETLKNYLELEQKMSSKKFEYAIEINLNNMDAEEILIPPMLLQPFIENSIKHGIQPNSSKGKIVIYFKIKQHALHCSIIDNGIGFQQSKKENEYKNHSSVGLKITKERINNISKSSTFKIEEIKENKLILGTKVSFKIPLKTDY